jgi:hypothetical protein
VNKGADNEHDNKWREKEEQAVKGFVVVPRFVNRTAGSFIFTLRRSNYGAHTGSNAAIEIALLKSRNDFVRNDSFAKRVGQRAFQPVTSLDKQLVILRENKQDDAIVLLFGADTPRARDSDRVFLDRGIALHCRVDGDNELVAGVALELRQLVVETRRGTLRNNTGVIVEVILRCRRNNLLRLRNGTTKRQPKYGDESRHGLAAGALELKSNCTFGGVSAPGVAVKYGFSLKPKTLA